MKRLRFWSGPDTYQTQIWRELCTQRGSQHLHLYTCYFGSVVYVININFTLSGGHQWQWKRRARLIQALGLDRQALASGRWLHVFHLESPSWPFSSLYFPLGREMPVQEKWKLREKASNTHTHTQCEERGGEQKRWRQNGFHSHSSGRPEVPYFFLHSVVSLHFSPPFIFSTRHMAEHRAFKSYKRCLHTLYKSLWYACFCAIVCKSTKPRSPQ